jgi:Tfp pilus assembly protein PilX
MRNKTENRRNSQERGVALLFALFTLLLLSAIAVSLVFMTNTETSVNSNYRAERVSSFAAKAGMEEVRDRMGALSLANLLPGQFNGNTIPGVFPPAAGSVLYVLNEGNAPGTVQPWTGGNAYMDDEICHDFAGIQLQQPASDVRCTTPPNAAVRMPASVLAPVTSNYPWNGTAAALPYKWVRVTLKQNNSVPQYPVSTPVTPANKTTQVCWNGSTELLVNAVDLNCQDNSVPGQPLVSQVATPVYMITSLAATATGSTRRMVQAEVALPPAQPFPYGLFATGTSCPAINLHGGGNTNPFTDAYNSKAGAYGGANQSLTGGAVGANGGVSLSGHAMVGGNIGIQSLPGNPLQVPCAGGDYNTSGANAGLYNPNGAGPNPNQLQQLLQPVVFPTPPDPTPLPTAASPQPGNPAVPGTYGDININGVLTLAPGVYNIHSLSIGGGSGALNVSPPGAVVLNFPSSSANPITITGKGILNSTLIPNDLQINYGGNGTISIKGQGASYAIVDAPNAAISVSGNGDFFGRLVGNTIDYGGNGKFHFDTASALAPKSNAIYQLISFREISY